MLRTLDRYIEEQSTASRGGSLLAGLSEPGRDRRFPRIVAGSIIAHLLFYAVIVSVDYRSIHRLPAAQGRRTELVKLTDLASPQNRFPVRSMPETLERADLSRTELDPNRSDDVLVPRSTRPAPERGPGGRLLSAIEIENRLRQSRAAAGSPAAQSEAARPQPPAAPPVVTSHVPSTGPLISRSTLPESLTPAPAPPQPRAPAANQPGQGAAQTGARRGEGSEPRALGLESVLTQYHAAVRAKIIEQNEKIMPREWIMDMLTEKVAAVYQVKLVHRGDAGQIASVRLIRTSRHTLLDDRARQAILIAQPFKGWPQNAGDEITLNVTVYYTPLR